jgi:hypothetical protein
MFLARLSSGPAHVYSPASASRAGPMAWACKAVRQFPQFQLKMQESILDEIRDDVQSPLYSDWSFHDKVLFCMQVGCTAKTPRGAETNDWR